MELTSLALRTGLILNRFLAVVEEKEEYIVIRTPDRPSFFWGNSIIMKNSPTLGDYQKWIAIFEKEIGSKNDKGFIAITFDSIDERSYDVSEFEKNNFEIMVSKVLSTNSIIKPPKFNPEIIVKAFKTSKDWDSFVDIHFIPDWGYGSDDGQRVFLKEEGENFKKFVETGRAQRFGAFYNGQMVAELGVFWQEGLARFNSVATHRDYRRLGACSTLVYEVSRLLLNNPEIETLVMEADEDYHAASIYESVGFVANEKLIALEWKDDKRFG
jgi:hypothetical protein